jgi:hypothetical protein
MVNKSRNIIRKQSVELDLINPTNAYQTQEKIRKICNTELLDELDAIFSHYAGENGIIRIDKLEIDLGVISSDGFLSGVLEKVKIKLAELPLEGPTFIDKQPVSFRQRTKELFLFFLKKGYFPWWAEDRSLKQLEVEVLTEMDKDFAEDIGKILIDNKIQLRRLVSRFSDELLQKIVHFIQGGNEYVYLLEWFQSSLTEQITAIPKNLLRDEMWKYLINWTIGKKPGINEAPVFLKEVSKRLVQTFHLSVRNLYVQLSGSRKESPFGRYEFPDHLLADIDQFLRDLLELVLRERLLKEKLKPPPEKPESTSSPKMVPDKADSQKESIAGKKKHTDSHNKKAEPTGSTESDYFKTKTEEDTIQDEEIYVFGAGLVLLHPFLPTLFNSFNFLLENNFSDETSRQHAVYLLGFLESGNKELPEHHLVLHKLLCGMPIDEPLMRIPDFDKDELVKTDELLEAVIGHWQALKNTSAEGLRQTFLQREGKLTIKDESCLLQVEQKTYDILLDKFPWGYSTIKLPWMKKILHVEWA